MAGYDRLVAFGLLSLVGGKMLWDACRGDPDRRRGDPTRGLMLVTLSLATSIDALAVGVSMALLKVSDLGAQRGDRAGGRRGDGARRPLRRRLGPRWGRWAEAGRRRWCCC